MNPIPTFRGAAALLFLMLFGLNAAFLNAQTDAASVPCLNPDHPMRIPASVDGKLMPREIGCWFPRAWEAEELEGFKPFIDAIGNRAAFDLIAVSSRLTQNESISPKGLKFQEDAARYAAEKYGILMLPDAEIRLSRRAYHEAHPDLSLCRLKFAEVEQKAGETVSVVLTDSDLRDHYTHNYAYEVLGVRLVKVWSFTKKADGTIDAASVRNVTDDVKFLTDDAQPGWCQCVLEGVKATESRSLCVAAAFEFLYPDVHSDAALAFERKIFESHADFPVGGCVKDEWGFLPCHEPDPARSFFWFSDSMAQRYAKLTGRELTDDLFLMHAAQSGRSAERRQAIDAFNQMNLHQLLRFEEQLYQVTKAEWGPDAMPATHPTWHAYPNPQEFRKNSLFWWRHPRDFAQTDEYAPFPCRTGMSKREGRVWFNEFYANQIDPYAYEEWTCAAAGGLVNVHPFCCASPQPLRTNENFGMLPILDAGIDAIRAKTRLLGFACDAPLFCPAAVIFGHWGCLNWDRPEYGSLTEALQICDFFAAQGFPADLIPSSEAGEKTLSGAPCWTLSPNGLLRYGSQEYALLIFYAVTDSDRADFERLEALNRSGNGKTRILTLDAHPTKAQIAAAFASGSNAEALAALKAAAAPQTPWVSDTHRNGWSNLHFHPGFDAFSRRLDGSLVWTRASYESPAGLPIHLEKEPISSNDQTRTFTLTADANGLLACRFDASGSLEMLTAAGLTRFSAETASLSIQTDEPVDLAIWKGADGRWSGIFQGTENRLPKELKALPVEWKFLEKP